MKIFIPILVLFRSQTTIVLLGLLAILTIRYQGNLTELKLYR